MYCFSSTIIFGVLGVSILFVFFVEVSKGWRPAFSCRECSIGSSRCCSRSADATQSVKHEQAGMRQESLHCTCAGFWGPGAPSIIPGRMSCVVSVGSLQPAHEAVELG